MLASHPPHPNAPVGKGAKGLELVILAWVSSIIRKVAYLSSGKYDRGFQPATEVSGFLKGER